MTDINMPDLYCHFHKPDSTKTSIAKYMEQNPNSPVRSKVAPVEAEEAEIFVGLWTKPNYFWMAI